MKWNEIIRIIKFGIVGIANSLISYVIYLLLTTMGMHYVIANIIGFTVSVINSYYWNNKYVFKTSGNRRWWKSLLKTYLSYAGTGIILSNILLFVWVNILEISTVIAPIINLIVVVPINYCANKFWAYKDE